MDFSHSSNVINGSKLNDRKKCLDDPLGHFAYTDRYLWLQR